MALPDFTGQYIQDTYQRVLQKSGSGDIVDGTGSLFIPPNAISASYATSASYEINYETSSSYAETASLALSGNGIFSGSFSGSYAGDGSSLTGISPFPFTGDASITGSLTVSGSFHAFKLDTDNVILGDGAAANIVDGAEYNVIIGKQAAGLGTITTGGDRNVLIGYQAGYDLTGGLNNVYMGNQAGFNLTSGRYNVGIGEAAGYGVTDNWGNIHIGQNTGVNCDGAYNVNLGYYAGTGASGATPDYCTFIGFQAGRLCHDTDWDIAIGYKALYNINDGNNNIAIGREAGYNITDSHNNIIIGSGSLGDAGMNDQLRIGNGNSLTTISASLATGDIIFPSTASAQYFVGDGSKLTGIAAGTNLTQSLFVSPSGNDGTAVVGDLHLPFKTILSATASANIGDTIMVYPGTYSSENSNIIKDGVNYYFYPGAVVHPTASLNEWVVNIIDPVYPVNVRGAGTFISDDTTYGAIKIQAKECYFEFDTAKTTNNTTITSHQGGTVDLEPTNTDGGVYWSDHEKGNPFYVKGNIVNTGDLGTYAGALVFGRSGMNQFAAGLFEGSVMQLHPTDDRPAIYVESDLYYYTVNINATVFSSGSEAVLNKGRGDIKLRGSYTTGNKSNKYAINFDDGYHGWYDIDADINGSLRLNCGSVNNTGGILRGTLRTISGTTPDDCAIYIDGGGQHKIDNQIFLRDYGAFGIKMDTDVAQVEFTGDFNADAASSYINFCKVTTGKLIFKGSLGSTGNRGSGNIIDGGHLVIDSFFDNDGYNYPNNSYCFVLSAGTLEINNKVTHAFPTSGSGIVDMTGGYLKLNGAELVQLSGTGSWAYGVDLNGGSHSGSILNNSFTNLTPFGPGSFTNEIAGGGTLFYSDKLY